MAGHLRYECLQWIVKSIIVTLTEIEEEGIKKEEKVKEKL